MYNVKSIKVPKGYTSTRYINEILGSANTPKEKEQCKDTIFRLVYPLGYKEVRKYSNIIGIEDGLSYMSIAFMKTFNSYDPSKKNGSFLNYFKLAIRSQILEGVYGKYRATKESMDIWYTTTRNMEYLDEPLSDKDEKDNNSRAALLTDNTVDFDEEINAAEFRKEVHEIIDRMFAKAGKHKLSTEEIFKYYIDSLMTDEPLSYAEIARRFNRKSDSFVRKTCVEYKKLFIKEWNNR